MKILAAKVVFLVTIICLIAFPIVFYSILFLLFYPANSIVPAKFLIYLALTGFVGECFFLAEPTLYSVIIKDGYVSNYINDGTENYGWREEIANIQSVALVSKEEVQKYYRQFNKRKAILIDFGHGNIKYIYAGLFSKRQIKKIMKLLTPKQ